MLYFVCWSSLETYLIRQSSSVYKSTGFFYVLDSDVPCDTYFWFGIALADACEIKIVFLHQERFHIAEDLCTTINL